MHWLSDSGVSPVAVLGLLLVGSYASAIVAVCAN